MSVLTRKVVWGVVAGVAVAGITAAQPPAGKPAVPAAVTPAPQPDPVRAADPLGAMLADAKAAYGKVRDYSCTFTRQERVGSVLGAEQVAAMKVRVKPYSVAVRFARPEAVAGREASYVEGSVTGKMKYRPKSGNGIQLVSLDDPKVLADNRHPLTEIGIGATLDRVAAIVAREKAAGHPVEVYASDFQFAGKTVARYEVFARRAHAHRYAYRCLVYVDKETKLPVRFEAYDAPKPGTTVGELLEAYSYTDVKLNVGLGDSAFE